MQNINLRMAMFISHGLRVLQGLLAVGSKFADVHKNRG
jgi:hypothetical protein